MCSGAHGLCQTQAGTVISDFHTGIQEKLNLYLLWGRSICGYFQYICVSFFP